MVGRQSVPAQVQRRPGPSRHACSRSSRRVAGLPARPAVPPTNNHAEQMLRPAVITRKVGGCNKNLLGALVHSILSSVMVTCHRRGKRFLDLARKLWQSNEPQAIPVDTLPDATTAQPVPTASG